MIKKYVLLILLTRLIFNPSGSAPARQTVGMEDSSSSMTVRAVMDSVTNRFDLIRDYMVIVRITVRMPGFRMPQKRVDLAFKQPDKIKVETTGFAVVPRTGLTMAPGEIFGNLAEPSIAGQDTLDGRVHWLITSPVHPDSLMFQPGRRGRPEPERPRVRLWIDSQRWVISRMEAYADTTRFVTVNAEYTEVQDHLWLPAETEFTFMFPENLRAQTGRTTPRDMDPDMPGMENFSPEQLAGSTGYVHLEFTHYRVNTGLSDRFFEREQ